VRWWVLCLLVILADRESKPNTALVTRAAAIEYPIQAVVEMAIASFLDSEVLGFADCKPGLGQ